MSRTSTGLGEEGRRLGGVKSPEGAYTITEFCEAFRISRSMFYKLQHCGKAPAVMRVGTRTLVSFRAAAEWRRERESASNHGA
jgi:hypothetical protein